MYLMNKIVDKKLEKWLEKYGDLSPEVKIKLKKLMNELKTNTLAEESNVSLKGTSNNCRFIRKYQGRTYEVVLQNGLYNFNGKVYKSLSAIALEITGTKWNGNRFFGVCK